MNKREKNYFMKVLLSNQSNCWIKFALASLKKQKILISAFYVYSAFQGDVIAEIFAVGAAAVEDFLFKLI